MTPTILIIDDNPKIIESLDLAFPEYQFVGASCGENGLKCLRRPNEIDLVILDYKLGDMDGIQVLKQIRAIQPDLGIILMTSFGTKEVVVEALRHDADDFIDKPYSLDEMRSKLENYFGRTDSLKISKYDKKGAIDRALGFIQRNYGKNPTLNELAEKTLLTPKYLSQKFKKEACLNFRDYKIRIKMEKARTLLVESTLTVSEIAYRIGYQNAESFMKAFKKELGQTPTEYRQINNVRKK